MSIAFTTGGKLWPQAAILREQYTAIQTEVEQIFEISSEVVDLDLVQATVTFDELTVEVQLLDTITGSLADEVLAVDIDFCT